MLRTLSAALIAAGALGAAAPAQADFGVKAGTLTCAVNGGWGAIIGSRKALTCTFDAVGSANESYDGTITRLGIDVGETTAGEMVWFVFAPTTQLEPGALSGRYFGVSAEATAGVGLGANVLLGGFDRSIALQPISIDGQTGANIAAGVAELHLEGPAAPPTPIQGVPTPVQ